MVDITIKGIKILFRIEKEKKAIKDIILRDIRNPFQNEEGEIYYEPVIVSNFWSNNHIEYESNGNRNKKLSVEESLNEIIVYLKDTINNLKRSESSTMELAIAINFVSSIDDDEERVMHSKSDDIQIMINDEAEEVIKKLFDSLKDRY